MREIKFRAWDGFRMRCCDDFYVRYGKAYKFAEFDGPVVSDWRLMQYTGLKDKNGAEIYEGDIVCVAGIGNCLVQWDCCGYWAFGVERLDYQDVIEDIESIIGNIYENQELLENNHE